MTPASNDTARPLPRALADSRVLIAGGTSGVGLHTAIQFALAGAPAITLIGRDASRGDQACAAVRSRAPTARVTFVAADANQPDQAAAAVAACQTQFGGVDVLVNCTVGPALPRLLHLIEPADIPVILQQQMLAPLLMSRLVLPGMRARASGVIINVASDAGKVATPGESVIGAAMAGIVMFSRALAMEAKRDGIRVNAITPSLIEGTLTYQRVGDDPFSAKLFAGAAKLASLGISQPDDLAHLIVFLARPEAARITGQAISPNGGISAA